MQWVKLGMRMLAADKRKSYSRIVSNSVQSYLTNATIAWHGVRIYNVQAWQQQACGLQVLMNSMRARRCTIGGLQDKCAPSMLSRTSSSMIIWCSWYLKPMPWNSNELQ